jgi:tRNA pseudouridine38-40 synthase
MKKIMLSVSYEGTDFSGFQYQPGKRTIQGILQKALWEITNEKIDIYASGRTDAGVHALGQVCHFSTSNPIPADKYSYILQRILPNDIVVRSSCEVDSDFHARKSVNWKRYRYQLDTNKYPNIFRYRFWTHLPEVLDVSLMQQAGNHLIGTHDFTSFCSSKTQIKNRIRTIFSCRVGEEPEGIYIELVGNGFLYHMVRIITGTLVEVGRKHIPIERIPVILSATNRIFAGPTFPPQGLVLMEVGYTSFNPL